MKILYVNILRILELITELKTFKFERAALASKGSLFMGNTVLTKSIKISMTCISDSNKAACTRC